MIIFGFLAFLLLEGGLLAMSARTVGSSRGRLRTGVLVLLILYIIGILLRLIQYYLAMWIPNSGLVIGLVILILYLVMLFIVLRRAFHLSIRRAFAPLGMYVAFSFMFCGVAVGLIKPFLIEAFHVTGGSMSPTIEPGDHLLANKVVHPRRWDLVMQWDPRDYSGILCKRLIGLPGDELRFEQGEIYINNVAVAVPSVLAGRCRLTEQNEARYKDGETIVLGEKEYFFVGDNVDHSADSRMYGPSDASAIIGVVDMIYWPLNRARLLP